MTTRFIIPAAPSPLPAAPSLSLLPFSLGPAHAPYTDNSANTSQYFQPRPLVPPAHVAGGSASSDAKKIVQATFRGRLVIGQYLSVPPAYRGLILSTGLAPNKGGTEDHSDAPLTPCASIDTVEEDTDGRLQRSTSRSVRIKGAGQIALSKPRTRRTALKKKRTLLDSDDDNDNHHHDGGGGEQDGDRPRTRRIKMTTPKKHAVPEIVIQEPTPLKPCSLAAPARRADGSGGKASPEGVSPVSCSPTIIRDGHHLDLPLTLTEEEGDTRIAVEEVEEPFIPSPEMENDSPGFSIPSPPFVKQVKEEEVKEEEEEGGGGPVRILYPKAQFQGFMLYTGDGPLVGFRADELEKRQVEAEEERRQMNESQSESQSQSQSQTETQTETSLEPDSRSNINLRPSWWRQGGAGEGGDEFVRGMGEWLGLVHVVSFNSTTLFFFFFFAWGKRLTLVV